MKWTYSINQKFLASASLFALCLLVLFSNYIDRNHTENVKNAISTLYEDRLIAEEYIFRMATGMYQIKEVINTVVNEDSRGVAISAILLQIREESDAYQETKFTAAERRNGDKLLTILDEFETLQNGNTQQQLAIANRALVVLNELSAIQLEESKQIMDSAEKLYLSGKTSSQFVFAVIIVIFLVLQAIVFTSKTFISRVNTDAAHLN